MIYFLRFFVKLDRSEKTKDKTIEGHKPSKLVTQYFLPMGSVQSNNLCFWQHNLTLAAHCMLLTNLGKFLRKRLAAN